MRERTEMLFPGAEKIYHYVGSPQTQILDGLSGITFPAPEYEIIRKHSVSYSIEYVFEGEGVIQENDKIYKVSAGDFFILHPNCYHHYFANPKNPWKKIFFTTDGDPTFIKTLLSLYHIDKIVLFKSLNSPLRLEEIFELFKSDKEDITQDLERLVCMLIVDLAHASKLNNNSLISLSTAKSFIDKRITTRIPVAEVADYVGLDYAYFSRAFKKKYGISPSQYILHKKIELSSQLLKETELPINAIASQLSFTDTTHFIKTFKSINGTTPTEYRKHIKQTSSSDKE